MRPISTAMAFTATIAFTAMPVLTANATIYRSPVVVSSAKSCQQILAAHPWLGPTLVEVARTGALPKRLSKEQLTVIASLTHVSIGHVKAGQATTTPMQPAKTTFTINKPATSGAGDSGGWFGGGLTFSNCLTAIASALAIPVPVLNWIVAAAVGIVCGFALIPSAIAAWTAATAAAATGKSSK